MLIQKVSLIALILVYPSRAGDIPFSNGYDYYPKTSTPYPQRFTSALEAFTSIHHDTSACLPSAQADQEQGEVVQSAAFPQVTLYHSNREQLQWIPIAPVTNTNPVTFTRARPVNRAPLSYSTPHSSPFPFYNVNRNAWT